MSFATRVVQKTPAGEPRWNGLLVLGFVVFLGLGSGAFYYHYKQPRIAAELEAELASAPTTDEGRVQQWERSMAPNIHHRIAKIARFSHEVPWLVTHAVRAADGTLVFWGLDPATLTQDLSHPEGMAVVIDLPAPVPLGPGTLDAESARFILVVDAELPAESAALRLAEHVVWVLERLPQALARDIEGAFLEVRVAGVELRAPQAANAPQPAASSGR